MMGKVKKPVVADKEEGQHKISSFFQKSSETAKSSSLFTQLGKPANRLPFSCQKVKERKAGTAITDKLIANKQLSSDVIVLGDSDDFVTTAKVCREESKLFGKAKLDKALKASANISHKLKSNKPDLEENPKLKLQNNDYIDPMVPETQHLGTPKNKEFTSKSDNNHKSPFQSPMSVGSDVSDSGIIPDTPENVSNNGKQKRPLGRSFLLAAAHFDSNPIQQAKENRDAKMALKKKRAMMARKSLVSVSVKFNETSAPNPLNPKYPSNNANTNTSKSEVQDLGTDLDIIDVKTTNIEVIDSRNEKKSVDAVDGTTPTKMYSGGACMKRMAKSGMSPDSKRTSSSDKSDGTGDDGNSEQVVKQLEFDKDTGMKAKIDEQSEENLESFKNIEAVKEMNRRAAEEIERKEKLKKEKQEKIEKEKQEKLEWKKKQEKEERKRNSEKMMKYQLAGNAATTLAKIRSIQNDDTLDDILQELQSPSILSNNLSQTKVSKDLMESTSLNLKTAERFKTNTSSSEKDLDLKVKRRVSDATKEVNRTKRYSLEGVFDICAINSENASGKKDFFKCGNSKNQSIGDMDLVKKMTSDWTDEDEKYFTNLGVKTDGTKGANMMNDENMYGTDESQRSNGDQQRSNDPSKLDRHDFKKRKSVRNNSDNSNSNHSNKVSGDFDGDDITLFPTPCFQATERSRSPSEEMEIDEFGTQTESQLICDELESMSPFKKKRDSITDTLFQSEAPYVDFGRHLVTGVQHDSVKQETVLQVTSQPADVKRMCVLHGFWLDTHVQTGDTVHVLATFTDNVCHITDKDGLLVVNPDLLLSGTTVVSSMFCMRRSILKEKFKGCESRNVYMLYGSIIHSVFQQVLRKKLITEESIIQEASNIVKKSSNLLEMYANTVTADRVMEEIRNYLPQIVAWTKQYTTIGQDILGNQRSCDPEVVVTKVNDIEENIWSPRFGIKGKIDLTVEVKLKNEKKKTRVLPLELKTGKPSYSVEHKGQVTLYSMMSSDRRMDPERGLLLYLKQPSMKVIPADHVNQKGLIQLRNEMAYYISRQVVKSTDDTETTFALGRLPEPISNLRACQKCPQVMNCAVYQRMVEGRTSDGSGMSGLVDETVGHLTPDHMTYFTHWCLMLDLESQLDQSKRTVANIWCQSSTERESVGLCFSGMVLMPDIKNNENDSDTVTLSFSRHEHCHRSMPLVSIGINTQDSVVISCEKPSWIAVCTGFVQRISDTEVHILTDSDAVQRLTSLKDKVFRLDKCDNFSTAGIFFTNVSRLLTNEPHCEKLRHLIIDREKPSFLNTLSKGNIEKVKTVFKTLNKQQKTAILKVLMSKDYVLMKGYPGTGKTCTIVALVKVLHTLGMSVLLTSYTHSAVDNILLKLKKDGVKFLRLGRLSKIHPGIKDYTTDALTRHLDTTAQLEEFLHSQSIVATSCLGTNHPLFTHRQFDVCIVDEASQVLQPACLGPLFSSKKFVLVGDPKQLPPVVQSKEARTLGMDDSMFARLDGLGATFDLNLQYRMNSEIMHISNKLVYEGCLQCGSTEVANKTLHLPNREWVSQTVKSSSWMSDVLDDSLRKSVIFLDTQKVPAPETREKGGIIRNEMEAKVVLKIVTAFMKAGITGDEIGIIAPYRSQVFHIRNSLSQGHDLTSDVEVNTVDQYQGRDKNVIIISFVRSSDNKESKTGELLKDLRRLNVAVTRAKTKLVLLGNVSTLEQYGPLRELIQIVQEKQQLINIPYGAV